MSRTSGFFLLKIVIFHSKLLVYQVGAIMGTGFPTFPQHLRQVYPPGFLDAEDLQKDFGFRNSVVASRWCMV